MPENTVSHTTEGEIVPNPTIEWEERMEKLSVLRDSDAKNVTEASNYQADYFNKNRLERTFKLGDQVWRKYHVLSSAAQGISAGLAHKYAGNYWIAKVLSLTVYKLANASGKIVAKASVADLKPYNRSFSQENAETRPIVADNEGVGQRRRVGSELRESAESANPLRGQFPAALASTSSTDSAFDATCTETTDFASQPSPSRCCSHDEERIPSKTRAEGAT